MNTKINKPQRLLTSILLVSLSLSLVIFGSYNVISYAQDDSQKILIESKSKVEASTDNNPYNNETIVRDYIVKEFKSIPNTGTEEVKYNPLANIPSNIILTRSQRDELKKYALSPGDGWKNGKLYISNPIEAARFIILYPYLAQYVVTQAASQVVTDLVRTGSSLSSLQSILIPSILFALLFSGLATIAYNKSKNF